MNILYINYFVDTNNERQQEYEFCISKNVEVFDFVVVLLKEEDLKHFSTLYNKHKNIKYVIVSDHSRPTFSDYFREFLLGSFGYNINIIANLDIVIPKETLQSVRSFVDKNTILALSRWDVDARGRESLYDTEESQDCWIFKGSPINAPEINFGTGIPGCDNSIAYILSEAGYTVINPSKQLKTLHYHSVPIRNYVANREQITIPKPYKFLPPC